MDEWHADPSALFFCENLYIYVYIDNFSLLTFFEKYITSLIKKKTFEKNWFSQVPAGEVFPCVDYPWIIWGRITALGCYDEK